MSGTRRTRTRGTTTDTWTFTDSTATYNNANGTVVDKIAKTRERWWSTGSGTMMRPATSDSGARDGHGRREPEQRHELRQQLHRNVPGGTAIRTFADATGNYNNATGTAAIVINKADGRRSASPATQASMTGPRTAPPARQPASGAGD